MATEITPSQLAMWRIVHSLARQGQLTGEQMQLLDGFRKRVQLTEEQSRLLESDGTVAPDIQELWSGVTEPRDRGQLIYYLRILFPKGSTTSVSALVDDLENRVLQAVDWGNVNYQIEVINKDSRDSEPKGFRAMIQRTLGRFFDF